jgi:hypothetical protein
VLFRSRMVGSAIVRKCDILTVDRPTLISRGNSPPTLRCAIIGSMSQPAAFERLRERPKTRAGQ